VSTSNWFNEDIVTLFLPVEIAFISYHLSPYIKSLSAPSGPTHAEIASSHPKA
jgi:hypothetical protein